MNKEIIDEIKELKQEISSLKEDIKKLIKICSRMDDHISFVNQTYSVVRKPLSAIINIFNRSIYYENDTSLPQIGV